MFEHLHAQSCAACGEGFRPSLRATCPQCTDGGRLRYQYRLGRSANARQVWAGREPWLWRFKELLPFEGELEPPPLHVGMTPLYGSPRLAARAGVRGLFVKDESRNPTGSIADRAAATLVAGAPPGLTLVTGALAPAVTAFAASAEREGVALVSEDAPWDPSLEANGARVLRLARGLEVPAALLACHRAGLALADRPNPLAFEGLKTLGLELGEQLAERLPDWIALDAREPELVEAVEAGLAQLAELGFYERLPRLLAVGGPGGDAQIALADDDLADDARAMQAALGLPIGALGAYGLAGLTCAVKAGLVKAESLALVVAQGPASLHACGTRPSGDVLRTFAEVIKAATLR